MFAFNSPGAKIDTSLLKGQGLAIYKIHGQSCHLIGSLLPMPGNHQNLPNYIYIYIQKMKLKTKLVQLGKLCFFILFALNDYMPIFIQLSHR